MRKLLVLGLMVLPLLVVGCSKGPAEAALKAADEAIAKAAPLAEKFVPDQFKTLTDAAAAAIRVSSGGNAAWRPAASASRRSTAPPARTLSSAAAASSSSLARARGGRT